MDKILKAADDILHVFDETAEWLDRDKGLVVKILTELVVEKFISTNSESAPLCKCGDVATVHKCDECECEDSISHL